MFGGVNKGSTLVLSPLRNKEAFLASEGDNHMKL
jgi:hypothetical protein